MGVGSTRTRRTRARRADAPLLRYSLARKALVTQLEDLPLQTTTHPHAVMSYKLADHSLDFWLPPNPHELDTQHLVLVSLMQPNPHYLLAAQMAYHQRRRALFAELEGTRETFRPLVQVLLDFEARGDGRPDRTDVANVLKKAEQGKFYKTRGWEGWRDYVGEAERWGLVKLLPPEGGRKQDGGKKVVKQAGIELVVQGVEGGRPPVSSVLGLARRSFAR